MSYCRLVSDQFNNTILQFNDHRQTFNDMSYNAMNMAAYLKANPYAMPSALGLGPGAGLIQPGLGYATGTKVFRK